MIAKAYLSPENARYAAGKQELEDPDLVLTDAEHACAQVWRDAESAAIDACNSDRPDADLDIEDGLFLLE